MAVECKECHNYLVTIATCVVCLAVALIFLKTNVEEHKDALKNKKTETRKIIALILARGGSKGIIKKNLALIQRETLLARTIRKIKQVKEFDEIWVSTDDSEISKEALKAGAFVHSRDSATAVDTAESIIAVQEFLNKHLDVEVIALIQCTSPFMKPEWLVEAHNKIMNEGYDSVFSVTRQKKLRWKLNQDKTLSAVNFNPMKRPRRQDWEGELVETGMFYFATRQLIEQNKFQGERVGCIEIPSNHSLEIDVQLDLVVAQSLATLFDETESN
uniref:N-acylneuraminate cytidylyltransferase n=2 Tax=Clastoptera arizonana TaxID=38151 RepID=A0A1B6CT69_9HEMI